MTNKTRKRAWSVSLVVSIGIIGVLAAFFVLVANPATSQAHDPSGGDTHGQICDGMTEDQKADHDAAARDIEGAPLCDGGTGSMEDNQAPVASGSLDDVKLRISMTHPPIDVSAVNSRTRMPTTR